MIAGGYWPRLPEELGISRKYNLTGEAAQTAVAITLARCVREEEETEESRPKSIAVMADLEDPCARHKMRCFVYNKDYSSQYLFFQ